MTGEPFDVTKDAAPESERAHAYDGSRQRHLVGMLGRPGDQESRHGEQRDTARNTQDSRRHGYQKGRPKWAGEAQQPTQRLVRRTGRRS